MKQAQSLAAIIARVKASTRLEDEVRRRGVELKGRDKRLEGHCPLPGHQDDTPSFNLYTRTQRYYCFGCDSGGDVLDFVQQMDGCSLAQACARLLGWESGPATASGNDARAPKPQPRAGREQAGDEGAAARARNEEHAPILTQAMTHYHRALLRSPFALSYLASRGVSLRTAQRCMLGYVDGSWRFQLMGKPHLWRAAQAAGLLTSAGREWLSGRLIVPEILDGKCIWLIGRVLPMQVPQRVQFADKKYLGLPIGKPLLGYGRASALLDAGGVPGMLGIHLVEGAIDYVVALEWELPFYSLSLLGTHASREHLRSMLALQKRLGGLPFFVNLDGDERGGVGMLRLLEQLSGHPALVIPGLAAGKDLGRLAELPDGYSRFMHALFAVGDGEEWP